MFEDIRRSACLAAVCLAAVCGPALSRAADSATASPASAPQAFALYAKDAPLAVRPLDDPANPYAGRYSDIDRWIYSHAWNHDELVAFRAGAAAWHKLHPEATDSDAQMRFVAAHVDPDGWMKPVELFGTDLSFERARGYVLFDRENDPEARTQSADVGGGQRNIFAGGPELSPEMYAETQLLMVKLYAARTPRIPDWLGRAPAPETIFVPNGEIVTHGAPGLRNTAPYAHNDAAGWSIGPRFDGPLPWQRYDASGQLLGELPADTAGIVDQQWEAFYWPQHATVLAQNGAYRNREGKFGLYWLRLAPRPADTEGLVLDPTTKAVIKKTVPAYDPQTPDAAFAYDGTALDLFQPLPVELQANRIVYQSELARLYAAQQFYNVWWGKD